MIALFALLGTGCLLGFPLAAACAETLNSGGPDVPHITQLLALPGSRILAVTSAKGGLYISGPGGKHWQRPRGVPDAFIHQAAQQPSGPLYLATDTGLYRADDPDGDWTPVAAGFIARLTFSPDGSLGLVKVWDKGLFAVSSADLSADKASQAGDGAASRADQLREEAQLRQELLSTHRNPFLLTPSMDFFQKQRRWQELVESGYRSWRTLSQGLPKAPVQTMALLSAHDGFLGFFGFGIYRWSASEFQGREASSGLASPWVLTLATSPWGDLYAGTFGAGLFIWNADRSEWMPVNPIFTGAVIQDLAFGAEGEILAASREQGLFLSLDQGRTWRHAGSALPGTHAQGVAVGSDGSLWVGLWDRGLYVSTDRGNHWRYRPFAHVTQVTDLAFAPNGFGYAFLAGLGLYESRDGGVQWTPLTTPVRPTQSVRIAVAGDGRLFIGSPEDGLWTSTTAGAAWERDMAGLPGSGVHDIVISPAGAVLALPMDRPDRYAAGLYERSSSGEWRPVPNLAEKGEEQFLYLRRLLFLPDGRAVAAGSEYLLISEDGGQTWRPNRFAQLYEGLAVDAAGTLYTQRMTSTFAKRRDSEQWEEAPSIPPEAYWLFQPVGEGRWVAARRGGGVDLLAGDGQALRVVKHGLEGQSIRSLGVGPDGSIFVGLKEGLKVWRKGGDDWLSIAIEE